MIERTFSSPYVDIAHLLVPVLWFGLLVGVCFVAVPVKFACGTRCRARDLRPFQRH